MATISIDTGTAQQGNRIADAFAAVYGYQVQVPNPDFNNNQAEDPSTNPRMVPNPVTKSQFVKQQVVSFIKQTVAAYEGNKAADQARATAVADSNSLPII